MFMAMTDNNSVIKDNIFFIIIFSEITSSTI